MTNLKKYLYKLRHWETWHWIIKYIPMIPFWIVYCFRARSCWFFTASNPTLTFGGFEGESKMEMYRLLPLGTYPRTILVRNSLATRDVGDLVRAKGFSFPVAVKPDVGRMGLLFRRINSQEELVRYHSHMCADYILQEYVHYPEEVSVFYYRFPNQACGTITGFVRKECLSVTGDGKSTLLELMNNYVRIQFRIGEMKIKHAAKLRHVIPKNERFVLSEALNLSRGGKLVSLEHEKTDSLRRIFDNLSHTGNFYYGRYDIKCASIEDLKAGRNFSILEFNGSGAEPHHVYGNGNSFFQAISILLDHWNILFKISVENHKKGLPYWSFVKGYRHMQHAKKHIYALRALEFSKPNFSQRAIEKKSESGANMLPKYELTIDKS